MRCSHGRQAGVDKAIDYINPSDCPYSNPTNPYALFPPAAVVRQSTRSQIFPLPASGHQVCYSMYRPKQTDTYILPPANKQVERGGEQHQFLHDPRFAS
jgi:hypothetical protein